MDVKIGVLALQGDVSEHIRAFEGALRQMKSPGEAAVIPLRKAGQIPDLDAIAIPGGESTTISRLIDKNGMSLPPYRIRRRDLRHLCGDGDHRLEGG